MLGMDNPAPIVSDHTEPAEIRLSEPASELHGCRGVARTYLGVANLRIAATQLQLNTFSIPFPTTVTVLGLHQPSARGTITVVNYRSQSLASLSPVVWHLLVHPNQTRRGRLEAFR